jgi:hypothetical protein|tara:strand:+ start:712 stop:927 length:216 start_codon:yes stop_codon:yes gene_type:complete
MMEMIILDDGMYHLIPVTKEMVKNIVLVAKVNCFELCDILRLKLTTYSESLNLHMMNDGSGDFYGCMCEQN